MERCSMLVVLAPEPLEPLEGVQADVQAGRAG